MEGINITIITSTYNRAHTLPILYDSLKRQKDKKFVWLVIDDGSVDNTANLFCEWKQEEVGFDIIYKKVANGGKPRAINCALESVSTDYVFIVDSDDYLTEDAVEFLNAHLLEINKNIIGIGVLQGDECRKAKHVPKIGNDKFVDATNLERKKYELDYDANELYKTSILRQYPFEVWKNEKFVPEAVSLNRIALRGYKLRWYNKVLVVSDYLNDGMTKQSWSLLKNNPMGYAIAFNESLLYPDLSFKGRIYAVIQFIVLVLISGNWLYLFKSKKPLLTVLLIPLGGIWSIRRYFQLKKL